MGSTFLTAEWRKLAMANYTVDPAVLQPFVPAKTELDYWNNQCYVSLVGFMFLNTKLKGIPIPFHTNFPEVNLRFYVRYMDGGAWKRGVVFIKEIVPQPALTFVANAVYNENYETLRMKHDIRASANALSVSYEWKKGRWHSFAVTAHPHTIAIGEGSEEEFITEHFWGYTKLTSMRSSEYQVEHPRWKVYPVNEFTIDVDFGVVYGERFDFLRTQSPQSVFLAEGSEIIVRLGRKI
ncbi:MAG TPA: DUF2071 domain-containing protein [Chryseosolibacter sp.]